MKRLAKCPVFLILRETPATQAKEGRWWLRASAWFGISLTTGLLTPGTLTTAEAQIATRPLPIRMQGNHKAFEVFFDTFLRKSLEGDRGYIGTLIRADMIQGKTADEAARQWHQWLRSGRLVQPVRYRCQGFRRCEIEVLTQQWESPFRVVFVRDSASTGWIAEAFTAPVLRAAAGKPSQMTDAGGSSAPETSPDFATSPDQSANR